MRAPVALAVCLLSATLAPAQVFDPGPSDPALFDDVLNLPPDPDIGDFETLAPFTQLNVGAGGVVGNGLTTALGSEVNVDGGTIGSSLSVVTGSEVNVLRGLVGGSLRTESGSQVNISGGQVGRFLFVRSGSEVNISGGTLGRFDARDGSDVELIGSEFRVNGVPYADNTITLDEDDVFTGVLADGSSFVFSPLASDDLQGVRLTPVALPTSDLTPKFLTDQQTKGPFGLRPGQTLTVQAGGELPDDFAVVYATLNVEGGTVGSDAEVAGGLVNIDSGEIGFGFDAYVDSAVNISGGRVGSSFRAHAGSAVNVSGGTIGRRFAAFSGSDVEFVGGDYRLNGAPYTGSGISLNEGDVFSGALEDGTAFVFSALTSDDPFRPDAVDTLEDVTLTVVELPSIDTTPIVLSGPATDGPSSLRPGQSITVLPGGELRESFTAIDATAHIVGGTVGSHAEVLGSAVNITGGVVGQYFYAYSGSVVNVSGGSVGWYSGAFADSVVNVSGGVIGSLFSAGSGSVVNVSGGEVGGGFLADTGSIVNVSGGRVGRFSSVQAELGSVVNISGGIVGDGLDARSGSVVNISGGTVGAGFEADSGSTVNISGGVVGASFRVRPGSNVTISGGAIGSFEVARRVGGEVTLIGGEFRLNGEEYTSTSVDLAHGDVLTATLADGSAMILGLEALSATLVSTTLPAADPTPRIVDTPITHGPFGLRAGQTLTLRPGGSVPDGFAVVDATLNVDGGSVGYGLEVAGGEVNIYGGEVGGGLGAYADSVVNVFGGTVGGGVTAGAGSVVNVSGGIITGSFSARSESVVNVSGGEFLRSFSANADSVVNIRGGDLGDTFSAFRDSEVHLVGVEFLLDGVEVGGLSVGETIAVPDRNATLSGVLADGSSFSIDLSTEITFLADYVDEDATLTVTLVESGLPGDFNNDGFVDTADFAVWRDHLGQSAGALWNDTAGGVIGQSQYALWSANRGASLAALAESTATIPEPAALVLAAMGCLPLAARRR